ncbi:MAG: hypothetical protein OEX07_01085 [Gammaproteobacteria bacterium]|nr:hypothetical protein [Gammaproteobacteria bacterium]
MKICFSVVTRSILLLWIVLWTNGLVAPGEALANPVFARQYNMSCSVCHAAFPRLNTFGQNFVKENLRLPGWKEQTGIDTDDEMLVLPKIPPIAFRVQGYAQSRSADVANDTGTITQQSDYDLQAPYLIKLFSTAPLSDYLSYYFYAMMAEKGANGEILVEDAWISHSNIFNTGVGLMAGQFQLSDLMFPRETRLTFQDFIPYRMAGITYDRGVVFSHAIGRLAELDVGISNGNGITQQSTLNSAGFKRPDHAFDNNRSKTFFGRLGGELGSVSGGIFIAEGKQENASNNGLSKSHVQGIDLSQNINDNIFWFAQYLQVTWKDFLSVDKNVSWFGGFVGVDYVYSDHWVFSGLYNYADANDLSNSGTIYEGIALNSLSGAVSYYFMRNAKLLIEANVDIQKTDVKNGVGHDTKEHYLLAGFDIAF